MNLAAIKNSLPPNFVYSPLWLITLIIFWNWWEAGCPLPRWWKLPVENIKKILYRIFAFQQWATAEETNKISYAEEEVEENQGEHATAWGNEDVDNQEQVC